MCPLKNVLRFYARLPEPKELVVIDAADHLFDGKASEVGDAVEDLAKGFPTARAPPTAGDRLNAAVIRRGPKFATATGAAMKEAVIVSAVRTAVGKAPYGTLRSTRPDDMAGVVIAEALERAPGLDPAEIDDVILGCAMPEGEQGLNVARIASLRAGVPVTASAVTVNRFCSSGLQAIAYGAERIMCGAATAVVAGGTESMSLVPMGGNKVSPNPSLVDTYPDVYISTGLVAENHAREAKASREEQDAFALRSHQRALAAIEAGRFKDEIVPLQVTHLSAENGHKPKIDDDHLPGRRGAAARDLPRGARQAPPGLPRHGHRHGRQLVADQRRRLRGDRDGGGPREGTGPHADGPVRHLRHGGRRAGALRHRAGLRDSEGAEARRA